MSNALPKPLDLAQARKYITSAQAASLMFVDLKITLVNFMSNRDNNESKPAFYSLKIAFFK